MTFAVKSVKHPILWEARYVLRLFIEYLGPTCLPCGVDGVGIFFDCFSWGDQRDRMATWKGPDL
jgi:hypothetical protein